MAKFLKVATTGELAPGQAKRVEVDGKVIALFNLEGSYHAIDDTCPHRGGPLSKGPVDGEVVTCPWHGSKFNVKSGDVLTPPARTGVSSYRIRVSGSDIKWKWRPEGIVCDDQSADLTGTGGEGWVRESPKASHLGG